MTALPLLKLPESPDTAEPADLPELTRHWDAEVARGAADPEGELLTRVLWDSLRAGADHRVDPESLAVPPGWQPRAKR